ncbi:hypothetical protein M0D21_20360 [Aquimarina sp. D1M17]|uniref:DUF6702 family protein n=1 Tax=Aquimarina acroporae TaxID=2937283 RepID=UPI0020BEBB1A|nr:DUF6702 family protein [Aquimarina acroporae]MCK8523942.1 hypothetical protein [Aquimarina acroporae]
MKKILLVLFFGAFLLFSSFTAHKFYVSVTQVDYNQEQQSLQIITRIFIDDLEEVLQERYDNSIELGLKGETSGVETYIKKYLNQKINFVVNGKMASFTYVGKEYEDDLLIFYLEIENITSFDTIEVSNQVLMDLFEEQQNIVHVKKGNKRKSLILEHRRDTGMLKFSE